MLVRRVLPVVFVALAVCGTVTGEVMAKAAQPFAQSDLEQQIADAKKATMADPVAGLEKARAIVALAEHSKPSRQQREALASGLWLVAEGLTRTNHTDEARAALDRAIRIASADGKVTALEGNLSLSRARIAHTEGDVAAALKGYHHAYDIFVRIQQARGQSIALQGLGVIYEEARDFDHAIDYYSRASEIYSSEPALQLAIANNVGNALRDAERYDQSLAHFYTALDIAKSIGSPYLEARVLSNIAAAEAKERHYASGERAANQALTLLGPNDESGWAPIIWGTKAELAYNRGNIAVAMSDLDRAFAGVDLTKTISPFRDTHELAWHIYRGAGKYQLALQHLEAFKRLDDQAKTLAASANLALMGARFDFANQKLEIEHLKTEQIRREASLKESRAATQRVLLISLILAALAVIVWISWRHRLLKRHRDVIHQANTELTRILGERDLEIARRVETEAHLRVAMEAAETANRAKTQFLANMSHELRTPLNASIGFSEMLATGMMPPARVQEYSTDINSSGRKLLDILADILDTARLDAGKMELDESDVQLGKTVESALEKVGQQHDLSNKNIRVTGDQSLCVRGDAQRLVQIVEKIVSNAVKFSGQSGTIHIELAGAADGGVDLTVTDDGAGIAAEQIDHILDHFGQIESTFARSHGGIGLGLPIAKSLVTLHGGTLRIASKLGQGTTVRIHLPAQRRLPHQLPVSKIVAA